jgi:hypothetical protein
MDDKRPSPRITRFSWGQLEVDGQQTFRDAKLFPGGAREWDWRETGTHHRPGIQPADVFELLAHGAKVVILSQGVQRQLRVSASTLQMLEEKQIPAHVLPTEKAVQLYNELRETEAVGGLFHSTC